MTSINLTPREREVLQHLAIGRTTAETANIMQCAAKTVQVHRTNLMRKVKIHDIVRLTHVALFHGIITVLPDEFEIDAGETLEQHVRRIA